MAKKKIILIVPYYSSNKVRRWTKKNKKNNKDFECYPPLGLMYLAGSVNQLKDYQVKILDANANRWSIQELREEIYREAPDIAGITVTSLTLNESYQIIKEVLNPMRPRPLIIVGGPHITKCPEALDYLGADYGFIADSEHSLRDFLNNYGNKDNIEKIDGLIYRKNGKLIFNAKLLDENINNIPLPDRSLINPELYHFSIVGGQFTLLLTSRGCPFNCIYCSVPHKRKYYCRNIVDVINEMKTIKEQKYKYINICDDIFTLERDRTVELCTAIIDNEINIKWGCATRADVLDLELLKLMKKANCIDVRLGIEAGSERIRREVLGKKISDEVIINAIDNIKKAKLVAVGFFLIGVPGETKDDINLTMKFARSVSLDYASFNVVTPLPGSRLHEIAVEEKKINSNTWENVALGKLQPPVYVPDNLDVEYLEKMVKKALKMFYLRPSYLVSQLLQIRNTEDLFYKLTVVKRLFF